MKDKAAEAIEPPTYRAFCAKAKAGGHEILTRREYGDTCKLLGQESPLIEDKIEDRYNRAIDSAMPILGQLLMFLIYGACTVFFLWGLIRYSLSP